MAHASRPHPTFQRRLEDCRCAMRRASCSALLVTHRWDQTYLTGFDGEDGACLITGRTVHLITDRRFETEVQRAAPWATVHLRRNGLVPAIAECLRSARIRTSVGCQAEHLTVAQHAALRRAIRPLKLQSTQGLVASLRLIKDAAELRILRRAIAIAEAGFEAARSAITVGMTESDLAARLEFEMRARGAEGPSFPTIVAEGRNAALPHARPGRRVLRRGSAVLVDWGARYGHYCSDLTRMVFIGTIPPRYKHVYQIVLEAQQRAIAAIAPGVRTRDIDGVARAHIAECGYAERFAHGLGHGIGLDVHEAPRLRPGVDDVLQPGMVVTVEPGIYLPGVGGVRIEDDVLVTARGHQVLTRLPRSLDAAVL